MRVENLFLVPKLFWPFRGLRSLESEVDLPDWTQGSLWLEHDSYIVERRDGSFKLRRVDYQREELVKAARASEKIWIPLHKTNLAVLTSTFLKKLLEEVWNRNYERKRFSKYILRYILEKLRVHFLRSWNYSLISRFCDDVIGKSGFPSIVSFALVERRGDFLGVERVPDGNSPLMSSAVMERAIDRLIEDMITLDRLGALHREDPGSTIDPKSLSFILNRSISHVLLPSNSLSGASYDWLNYFLRMHVVESVIEEYRSTQYVEESSLSQIAGDTERFVRALIERLSEENATPREYESHKGSILSVYELSLELSKTYEEIVNMLHNLAEELSRLRKDVKDGSDSDIHVRILDIIGSYVGLLALLSNTIAIPIIQSSMESLNILVIGDAFTTLMSFYNQYHTLIEDIPNNVCSYLLHIYNLCVYLAEFGMRDKCLSLHKMIPFIHNPSEEIYENLLRFSEEIIDELKKSREEFLFKLAKMRRLSPTVKLTIESCKNSLRDCTKSAYCKDTSYADAIRVIKNAKRTLDEIRPLNGLTIAKARHVSILVHGLLPSSSFRFSRENRREISELSVKLLLSSVAAAEFSSMVGNREVLRSLLDHIDQVILETYGQEFIEDYEVEEERGPEEAIPELFERVRYLFDIYSRLSDVLLENLSSLGIHDILVSGEKVSEIFEYLDSVGYYIPELLMETLQSEDPKGCLNSQ